ncbi:farnesyl diphosphate synthase-like isoform X2 [Bacillus rossius redtenbacheri]|uniref:farnesyl diphosphate synthase-like isoform X2 n=1 Tax=Bacillus rossius redtenbacheri TaxID=93214 RepID=UPI002FDC907F
MAVHCTQALCRTKFSCASFAGRRRLGSRYIVSDLAKLYADIPDAAGSLEQLQASGLVLDDLVDGSELRRGRPSWPSLRNSASNVALNDVSMIMSSVFTLLHRHFGSQLYYLRILQLFHQVLHTTFLGQVLDLKSHNSDGKPQLELFTMNRYRSMAKYKTGFYTFYFPVSIAIIMAGCNDVDEMTQLEDILFEMGIFYQIQNDYWDCYQDSGLTGKSGNDVKEGKCTWLSVVALQSASAKQKAAFQECYGHPLCSHTSVVKDLYEELDIHSKYKDYEQKTYDKLFAKICQVQHCVPHHVLFSILNMLFRKRTDVGLYR